MTEKQAETVGKRTYGQWKKTLKLPERGIEKLPPDLVEMLSNKEYVKIANHYNQILDYCTLLFAEELAYL